MNFARPTTRYNGRIYKACVDKNKVEINKCNNPLNRQKNKKFGLIKKKN